MTQIAIAKNDAGALEGLTPEDHKAWLKLWTEIEGLGAGEFLTLEYWFPRNPKLHRLHFEIIGRLFDCQERFATPKGLRGWLYVGAGHCELVPGLDGQTVAIPKSIAWSEIDDVDFQRVHVAMIEFIRGEHCRRVLWPRLQDEITWELVEVFLEQFERRP